MKNEIWRDIPGFEGIYQASNTGMIKSLHRGKDIIMKQRLMAGYYYEISQAEKAYKKAYVLISNGIHPKTKKPFTYNNKYNSPKL